MMLWIEFGCLIVMFLCGQDSEELSSEEDEMKIAEMRPPLIEISINQPKVVALIKDKKGKSFSFTYLDWYYN